MIMPPIDAAQAGIAAFLRHYATALAMPGHAAAYMEAITPAAWAAFPRGSRLHHPARFAEVLAFHAIKVAGLPFDQGTFRAASLLGDMPMNKRPWLLHYAAYLPPALRASSRAPSPETWLDRMPPGPVVDGARVVLATHGAALARLQPRAQAGAAIVVAWKRLGKHPGESNTIAPILAAAGIRHSSAYNAAVRIGLIPQRQKAPGAVGAATVA